MRKKLALLGFLMLVSVGMAYIVSASDALKGLAPGFFGRNEVTIDADLIYTKVSPDQKVKAVEIALGDPQVQEILEGVDNYCTGVSDVFDVQEIEVEEGGDKRRVIALIPKEGLALVEFLTYKEYDQEIGLRVYEVIVDLSNERVNEIKEHAEVRKPRTQEIGGIITTDELLGNPLKYHGQVVRVSGIMSDLGFFRCPCFTLDGKPLMIWYLHDEVNLYPTQIKDKVQNGDHVIVTGKFFYYPDATPPYTMYAEKVEKVTS